MMPRRLPKHVERFRDRHGKVRLYFRRGKGPRVPLPGDPASVEFEQAYADALAGQPANPRDRRKPPAPNTIAALILAYQGSDEWRNLRETTRIEYGRILEHLRDRHGHRSVSGITRRGILEHVLKPFNDRPGARRCLLNVMRVLVRQAIADELLKFDPTLGIKRPKGGEIRSWTDEEIAAFEQRWPIGTRERTAFALMLFTGQRRSDVHRMTWADLDASTIRVVQQKTGAKLNIEIHRALALVLAAAAREHVTILNTTYGKPFSADGLSRFMRQAINRAGLPRDAQPHGLRKAAGRRLAECGCTAKEIMSILGHSSLAEAERYTRAADQRRLATAAIHKLEGRIANNHSQTTVRKFGKNPKTKGSPK